MSWKVTSRYMFTLKLGFKPAVLGEFPDGLRLDLRYSGQATTDRERLKADWPRGRQHPHASYRPNDSGSKQTEPDPASVEPLSLEWNGFEGQIISGSDLALVRNDCVSAFNGIMTLRSPDRYLLNARMSGLVDLFRDENGERATLNDYQNGISRNKNSTTVAGDLDVALQVVFEGATSSEDWGKDDNEYKQKTYFQYQRLLRGQFMLVGKVTQQNGVVERATLDVLEVQGTSG